MRSFSFVALAVSVVVVGACSDSTGPANLTVKSGDKQSALAGTPVAAPIIITGARGENATFSVIAGGGTLSSTTGTVNSDGTVTAPTWTLGKSAVPQQLKVTIGSKTLVINATVQTSYKIDVRFFGRTLPAAQQSLFTNAAARLRAAIVGPIHSDGTGADPSQYCGVTGVAPFPANTTIDGIIIYASIDSIDAKGDQTTGNILAQSGPCYTVSDNDMRTVIGVMKFDSADINSLAGSGDLQEVVTHEMLHVIGFGSFWDSTAANLLTNYGPDVRYTGPGGIAGCQAVGGATICASSVPVEGTQGGDGTKNSHWRESTFCNELMTGFLNGGGNPLSVMTIRSLEDLSYTVDKADADPYSVQINCPTSNFRALVLSDALSPSASPGRWERPLPHRPRALPTGRSGANVRSN